MHLPDEILELISKSLPAATAGAMREFIDNAELVEEELELAKEKIEGQDELLSSRLDEIESLTNKIAYLEALGIKESDLNIKEEELAIRERDIELAIAKIQLTAANERNLRIESLVEKVFGHPSVSVSTYRNKPIMSNPDGSYPSNTGMMASETEDTTTATSKS